MKYLGVICARKGSKGLKNKNILNIGNIPLIAHSILVAKSIKKISKVVVSTDSPEIAKISKKFGAEVPFLRPKNLSLDDSKEIDAWKHAINFFKKKNLNFDAIISLPCTSPLRSKIDVNKCIKKFNTKKFDSIISIKESLRNPYFNMVEKKGKTLKIVNPLKKYLHNRQDAPKTFDVCTVCFISSTKFILKNNNLFQGKVGGVIIPKERSIDIDNELDYQFAKYTYENKFQI
ncbi:acylneuraminate cytidylyltransferase family protein [Candidatus Pelagibacter sp.]|nr:acylneuraminate cytidylyltransferase family protein [Candidatus Pelagibacter sp.]